MYNTAIILQIYHLENKKVRMKNFVSTAILLTLFSCVDYQTTNRDSVDGIGIPPLSIFHIETNLIGKTYIITGYTQTIPPSFIKKIKDFVFEINISVKVNGINTYWNSPFEVVLILPNGEIEYYLLNEEEFTLRSIFIEDFKIIVETPVKGRVKCALSLAIQHRNEFSLTDYDWWFLNLN